MSRPLIFVLIAALAGLAGACATASEVYLPDGRQGHQIKCDGYALTFNDCLAKAGEICTTRGYDLYARNEETGQLSVLTAYSQGLYGAGQGSYAGDAVGISTPTSARSILIACREGETSEEWSALPKQ